VSQLSFAVSGLAFLPPCDPELTLWAAFFRRGFLCRLIQRFSVFSDDASRRNDNWKGNVKQPAFGLSLAARASRVMILLSEVLLGEWR
jgi:hypothetical protein